MKKILVLTLAWRPVESGGEIAPRKIAELLSSEYAFDVLAYRFAREHAPVEKTAYGTVYRIGGFGHAHWKKEWFSVIAGFKALSLHKRNNYDAIWVVMATYNSGSAFIFNLFQPKVPILLTLQEGDPFEHIYKRLGFLRPLWHRFFAQVTSVQAISHYLADFAKQVGFKGEPIVIGNGVEIKRFERPSSLGRPQIPLEGPVVLVSNSRLEHKNAHDIVMRALTLLPERVMYTIVGGGTLEQELKELARELGLERRVAFIGQLPLEKMPAYLHRAHIFVRPSRTEGLGTAFLEAMAAGLPIIGTPVGGIPDFLTDGETGLFARVDDPQSVADAVLRLMRDPGLYGGLSQAGVGLVTERYSWEVISRMMRERFFDPVCKP